MNKSITNMSPGTRVLNVQVGENTDAAGKKTPILEQVAIHPGETKDMDIFNTEDRVFKGMVDKGELVVGEPGTKPPATPAEKATVDAAAMDAAVASARQAGYEDGFAKGLEEGKTGSKK